MQDNTIKWGLPEPGLEPTYDEFFFLSPFLGRGGAIARGFGEVTGYTDDIKDLISLAIRKDQAARGLFTPAVSRGARTGGRRAARQWAMDAAYQPPGIHDGSIEIQGLLRENPNSNIVHMVSGHSISNWEEA